MFRTRERVDVGQGAERTTSLARFLAPEDGQEAGAERTTSLARFLAPEDGQAAS